MTARSTLRHGLVLARFELIDYARSIAAFLSTVLMPTVMFIAVAEFWAPEVSKGALIPGIVGMVILYTGIFGIGVGVTEQRGDGTLKTFMSTPISFGSYLVGLVLSRVAVLVGSVGLMFLVVAVFYGVWFPASWPLFAVAVLLSAAVMLALGFLLASRTKKVESAAGIGGLVFMLGMASVAVDRDAIPAVIADVLAVLPFHRMVDALQRTWEGEQLGAALLDLVFLGGWLAVFVLAAARLFRWTPGRN